MRVVEPKSRSWKEVDCGYRLVASRESRKFANCEAVEFGDAEPSVFRMADQCLPAIFMRITAGFRLKVQGQVELRVCGALAELLNVSSR